VRHSGRFLLLAVSVLCAAPAPAPAAIDDFDEDPLESPDWELYPATSLVLLSHEPGILRATFPSGVVLDHWVGADAATQLRRSDVPDDFAAATRLSFLGSGDPGTPFWPPANEAYQACLMVYFSRNDVFYWGPYRGTALVLERSGQNNLCRVDPGLMDVTLRVVKVGQRYTFSYRAEDGDPWTDVCTREAVQRPVFVGLMFKSWNPAISLEETFEFDYFSIEPLADEAPEAALRCPAGAADLAWVDMPYVRGLRASGYPPPDFTVKSGPPGLTYDAARELLLGWTPEAAGSVAIEIELTNRAGSTTLAWSVQVESPSLRPDDDFDSDPAADSFWELYEPQTGIAFSNLDVDGNGWWRLQVPQSGDQGLNFDSWTAADRAPQLRHFFDGAEDFVVETRARIVPPAPVANAPFLSGLLLYFDVFDFITWSIGQERMIAGSPMNVLLERSGINNIAHGSVPGLLTGVPVGLRVEKRCERYSFFYRAGEEDWRYVTTYVTGTPLQAAGLVVKTWGGGAAFTTDFDYFDFLEPGPRASFTLSPEAGAEPLRVEVNGAASSSAGGPITDWRWDFGDGATASGVQASHTYARRGRYTVRLTVTDASGDRGAARRTVDVHFASGDVSPWLAEDISSAAPPAAGGARLEGESCLRVLGGGRGILAREDELHFVHRAAGPEATVEARLEGVVWEPPTTGRAGLMFRESLAPGAAFGYLHFIPVGLDVRPVFLSRLAAGESTLTRNSTLSFTTPRAYLRLERRGEELIGWASADGAAWSEVHRVTIPGLPNPAPAGFAVTSRDGRSEGTVAEAYFCAMSFKEGDDEPPPPRFVRGDANADGAINLTDALAILGFLYLGSEAPACMDAADFDDDGGTQPTITDVISLLGWLFLGGRSPPPPSPTLAIYAAEDCGPDPTADALDCARPPPPCR
jgi:hypothetical protein